MKKNIQSDYMFLCIYLPRMKDVFQNLVFILKNVECFQSCKSQKQNKAF